MSPLLKKIAKDVLRLAPEERAELADFLAASLESSKDDEVQRLWIDEAMKRLDEIRTGAAAPMPAETILAEARDLARR